MSRGTDPEGSRLPIKVDTTSNGEFCPRPLEKPSLAANRLASERAGDHARRSGMARRAFLTSACGAAGTLLAFNEAHAAFGRTGGYYDIPAVAALDQDAAREAIGGGEFIFDIQGHHVNPRERWRAPTRLTMQGLKFMPQGKCDYPDTTDEKFGHVDCFTGEAFIKEMFLDSDTDMAVLTFAPTSYDDMGLTDDEAARTRAMVDAMEGNHRLLVHGRVIPNFDGDIERMPEIVEEWGISAWKTYTQASPDGSTGWRLDDEQGAKLIEAARASGVKNICIHKGLPLPTPLMTKNNRMFGGCSDVGAAAKANPDINFIVYHSGYDIKDKDGPFTPGEHQIGVDSLIQSLIDNEVGPSANVYAELGTTWRYLMRDPEEAAHVMGKLYRYIGEDRIVWGTDSIWYGSPQDQIQAFRTFQIAPEFREKYGYPEITPLMRQKVFGLNAAGPYGVTIEDIKQRMRADPVRQAQDNYRNNPDPSFATYGPRTRREFLNLLASGNG